MAIIIKDEHISEVCEKGVDISEVLSKSYEGEIADRVSKDSRLAKLDPVDFAFMDAGISKSSRVQDFFRTTDSTWLFPVYVDKVLKEVTGNDDILKYLVSGSPVTVPSTSIQGAYIDLNEATNKKGLSVRRVAEGAELPKAFLKLGEYAIALHKYGACIEATYETIMYQSIELFGRMIEYIGRNTAKQQVEKAIDVLINGDGNDNAATTDTMTGSLLTAADIIAESIRFYDDGLRLDTIVAPADMYLALTQMIFKDSDEHGAVIGQNFNFPQGVSKDINVIYNENIPKASGKSQILCIDSRYALTKYVATGSQLREIDRNIKNQTHIGTISEITGFAKPIKSGARMLKAGNS